MKPKMVDFMDGVRTERLQEERSVAIKARLKALDEAVVRIAPRRIGEPSIRDIALGMPEVQAVLDAPTSTKVTTASFGFLAKTLPAFTERWKQDARAYLAGLVRAGVTVGDATDPLTLAAGSVFWCRLCYTSYRYPLVLSHTCFARQQLQRVTAANSYEAVVARHAPAQNWQPVEYEVKAEKLAKLVAACGMDPATATIDDMDNSDVRLCCTSCWYDRVGERKKDFYSWRAMVRALLSAAVRPLTRGAAVHTYCRISLRS